MSELVGSVVVCSGFEFEEVEDEDEEEEVVEVEGDEEEKVDEFLCWLAACLLVGLLAGAC